MEYKRQEVDRLSKQLRPEVASSAAGSIELAAVHAELESQKAKMESLDEALKVN